MNKLLVTLLMMVAITVSAQKPDYYNGTSGLKGEALKAVLHEIINDHIDFSYGDAKYILNYAQEDPSNTDNLIQFYTNRSVAKDYWGTGENYCNREHIWAQSHGYLSGIRPMDGDAHNLHAADGSVNVTRSNYDFDEVTGGTYIDEADAYYSSNSFEPADRDKGAVARTLMYMAVRYEGDNGEMDLELADALGTAPSATHGKLSTLLSWNNAYPPTDWERRRNDRVEQCQGNRNPFIDHPEYADLIWANGDLPAYSIGNVSISPIYPQPDGPITLTVNTTNVTAMKLLWGTSYDDFSNENTFTANGDVYSVTFTPQGIDGGSKVYCQLVATTATVNDTIYSNINIEPQDQLTTISAIQGAGDASTLKGQAVAATGIVTANFDNTFIIQSEGGARNGVTVYSNFRGYIGDSVKVVGKVAEYNGLTEISNVTSVYNYGQASHEIIPDTIGIADISEDYEGGLVVIKGVSFNEGGEAFPASGVYPYPTFTISDGVNSITFYTRYGSRLGELPIPSGTIDLKAVVSEYNGTYQVMSNDTSWFLSAVDHTPPTVVSVEVEAAPNNRAWVNVKFNEIVSEEFVEDEDNFSISNGVTIAKCYYYSATPNSASILVNNIGKGEYTITMLNVEDQFDNVAGSITYDFTSDYQTAGVDNVSDESELSIAPLPVNNGTLKITSKETIKSMKLFSLSGQLLLENSVVNTRSKNFDVSILSPGNYILQIALTDKIINKVIIVQ